MTNNIWGAVVIRIPVRMSEERQKWVVIARFWLESSDAHAQLKAWKKLNPQFQDSRATFEAREPMV